MNTLAKVGLAAGLMTGIAVGAVAGAEAKHMSDVSSHYAEQHFSGPIHDTDPMIDGLDAEGVLERSLAPFMTALMALGAAAFCGAGLVINRKHEAEAPTEVLRSRPQLTLVVSPLPPHRD